MKKHLNNAMIFVVLVELNGINQTQIDLISGHKIISSDIVHTLPHLARSLKAKSYANF
jgi:hypothetical protein